MDNSIKLFHQTSIGRYGFVPTIYLIPITYRPTNNVFDWLYHIQYR